MVGTRILHDGKYRLLTADCGYSRRSWNELIFSSVVSDKPAFENSLSVFAKLFLAS